MKLITLPTIIVICYMVGEIIKVVFENKPKVKKTIPFIMGLLGLILGVAIFYTNKELIQTTNIWDSMLIGSISGLCATGTNEVLNKIKELKENKIYENNNL